MENKGVLSISLIVMSILAVFLVGFVMAEDNNSLGNNNSGNDNNQTPNNNSDNNATSCTEDSDCTRGYECEDGLCVLDDDDEEENETDDDSDDNEENETSCEWRCGGWSTCANNSQTRTCENPMNCTSQTPKLSRYCAQRDKVCCKSTEIDEDNETKIEYEYEDRSSCVSEEGETKEIVEKSLCMNRIREECDYDSVKDRVKCRLENRNRFANFSESNETCEGLRNKGLCVALYVRSQNCFKFEEGEKKDRCFKQVAEFRQHQLNKEVNESTNQTKAKEKVRTYMVLVLENLQKRAEKAVENGKLTSLQGANIIERIVELKQSLLNEEDKETIRLQIQELKNLWKVQRLENE
jgi:hypothetical protein